MVDTPDWANGESISAGEVIKQMASISKNDPEAAPDTKYPIAINGYLKDVMREAARRDQRTIQAWAFRALRKAAEDQGVI